MAVRLTMTEHSDEPGPPISQSVLMKGKAAIGVCKDCGIVHPEIRTPPRSGEQNRLVVELPTRIAPPSKTVIPNTREALPSFKNRSELSMGRSVLCVSKFANDKKNERVGNGKCQTV